jgi:hydrogenase maturation protease
VSEQSSGRSTGTASPHATTSPQPEDTGKGRESARLLLVALGNPLAGDDGAGVEIARRLIERGEVGCQVRILLSPGVELLDAFASADVILLVDAVSSGSPPGTLHLVPLVPFQLGEAVHRTNVTTRVGSARRYADQSQEVGTARGLPEVEPHSLSSLSTHGFGLQETLELARALGRCVPRLMLLGVEAEAVAPGAARSPAVERAISSVLEQLPRLLSLLSDPAASLWRSARHFPPESDSFPGT